MFDILLFKNLSRFTILNKLYKGTRGSFSIIDNSSIFIFFRKLIPIFDCLTEEKLFVYFFSTNPFLGQFFSQSFRNYLNFSFFSQILPGFYSNFSRGRVGLLNFFLRKDAMSVLGGSTVSHMHSPLNSLFFFLEPLLENNYLFKEIKKFHQISVGLHAQRNQNFFF